MQLHDRLRTGKAERRLRPRVSASPSREEPLFAGPVRNAGDSEVGYVEPTAIIRVFRPNEKT